MERIKWDLELSIFKTNDEETAEDERLKLSKIFKHTSLSYDKEILLYIASTDTKDSCYPIIADIIANKHIKSKKNVIDAKNLKMTETILLFLDWSVKKQHKIDVETLLIALYYNVPLPIQDEEILKLAETVNSPSTTSKLLTFLRTKNTYNEQARKFLKATFNNILQQSAFFEPDDLFTIIENKLLDDLHYKLLVKKLFFSSSKAFDKFANNFSCLLAKTNNIEIHKPLLEKLRSIVSSTHIDNSNSRILVERIIHSHLPNMSTNTLVEKTQSKNMLIARLLNAIDKNDFSYIEETCALKIEKTLLENCLSQVLETAIIIGDYNVVESLLKNGATFKYVKHPIILATRKLHHHLIPLLIEYHAQVNEESSEGITPLCIAAQRMSFFCVEQLVKHGAYINSTYFEKTMGIYLNPLLCAIIANDMVITEFLLSKWGEQNLSGLEFHCWIHFNMEMIYYCHQKILSDTAANKNTTALTNNMLTTFNNFGITIDGERADITPLFLASLQNNIFDVKNLLALGANVNAYSLIGTTPLMAAVSEGNIAVAIVLLQHGAKTLLKSEKKQQTALEIARENNSHACVLLLTLYKFDLCCFKTMEALEEKHDQSIINAIEYNLYKKAPNENYREPPVQAKKDKDYIDHAKSISTTLTKLKNKPLEDILPKIIGICIREILQLSDVEKIIAFTNDILEYFAERPNTKHELSNLLKVSKYKILELSNGKEIKKNSTMYDFLAAHRDYIQLHRLLPKAALQFSIFKTKSAKILDDRNAQLQPNNENQDSHSTSRSCTELHKLVPNCLSHFSVFQCNKNAETQQKSAMDKLLAEENEIVNSILKAYETK